MYLNDQNCRKVVRERQCLMRLNCRQSDRSRGAEPRSSSEVDCIKMSDQHAQEKLDAAVNNAC
jgi:hypothetical protein